MDHLHPFFEKDIRNWYLLDRLKWLTVEIVEFDRQKNCSSQPSNLVRDQGPSSYIVCLLTWSSLKPFVRKKNTTVMRIEVSVVLGT